MSSRLVNLLRSEIVFRSLMKTQWLKPSELELLQIKNMRALIKHAYQNVPYYHRVFKERNLTPNDINSTQDLQKLPVLTKGAIRRNFQSLVAQNFHPRNLTLSSTSGSSGEPLRFMNDRSSVLWINAAVLRSFYWAGYRRFDKMVSIRGLPEKSFPHKPWQREITISTFGASPQRMKHYINVIKRFKPKGIRGYASSLYVLARLASDIQLDFVISSSEMLFKRYRKLIEERFGCKVFDNYSSREAMIAAECEKHEGYHIATENVVVEFVRNNEHVTPGETGKILISDLTRYGMPFIRYGIGDLGKPSGEKCSCGRGLPLMKSLEGHVADAIFTPTGKYVSSAVTMIFDDLDIEQFQIIQKSREKLIVKIVKGPSFNLDTHSRFIIDSLQKYLGDIEVEIEFVEDIPILTMSGKRHVIISEVNTPETVKL